MTPNHSELVTDVEERSSVAAQPLGLLPESAITELSAGTDRPLIEQFTDDRCKAARYDISMTSRGEPGTSGVFVASESGEDLVGPLVLHPGDSAWVASFEQFDLPPNVAGSVALRAKYASRGLFLLSGSVVDPGYGSARDANNERIGDGRLHFFLANFGSKAIVIEPDPIEAKTGRGTCFASVQFTRIADTNTSVAGSAHEVTGPDRAEAGLGFIEGLKELQVHYSQLSEHVMRGRDLMRNLIIAAYLVLATAVISTSLATILTITTNGELVGAIERAVPNSTEGKALVLGLALSLAWAIHSVAVALGPGSRSTPEPISNALRERLTAIRVLRAKERQRLTTRVSIFGAFVVFVAFAIDQASLFDADRWPGWIVLALLGCAGIARVLRHDRRPVTDGRVRRLMDEWAKHDRKIEKELEEALDQQAQQQQSG